MSDNKNANATTAPAPPTEPVNETSNVEAVDDQVVVQVDAQADNADVSDNGDVEDNADSNDDSDDGVAEVATNELAPGDCLIDETPEQQTLHKINTWFPQTSVQSKWSLNGTCFGNIFCELLEHAQSKHVELPPHLQPFMLLTDLRPLLLFADVPEVEQEWDAPALAWNIFTNRAVRGGPSVHSWHGKFRMDQRETQRSPRNAATYFIALADRMAELLAYLSSNAYGFKGMVTKKKPGKGNKIESVEELDDLRAWKSRLTQNSQAVFAELDVLAEKLWTYNEAVRTHFSDFIQEADQRAEEAKERRAKEREEREQAAEANVASPSSSGRVTEVKHNATGGRDRGGRDRDRKGNGKANGKAKGKYPKEQNVARA
jgi:hypothetical protein